MNALRATSPSQPRGISLKEAAAHAGVKPQTYRRLENEGVLPRPIFRDTYDRLAIEAVFDERSGLNRASPTNAREIQLDRWLRTGGGRES